MNSLNFKATLLCLLLEILGKYLRPVPVGEACTGTKINTKRNKDEGKITVWSSCKVENTATVKIPNTVNKSHIDGVVSEIMLVIVGKVISVI